MSVFLQTIGAIASLTSIPLAVYLYLRSKDARFDRIKRDIVKILLYQIGEERKLKKDEIFVVITSKLRENRLKTNLITVNEISEDMVAEIISSPLINKERKADILSELRKMYDTGIPAKYHIDRVPEGSKVLEKDDAKTILKEKETNWITIKSDARIISKEIAEINKELQHNELSQKRLSSIFAKVTAIILNIIFFSFLLKKIIIPKIFNDETISKHIEFDIYTILMIGATISAVAIFISFIVNRKRMKSSSD